MVEHSHEVLCWNCRKLVLYKIKSRQETRVIRGETYCFNEKYALCEECHEEITVPGLDDENEYEMDCVYRVKNDLITIDEIALILKKYNIEKRPLSKLLGLGELTITRYLDGQLPSKRYSDMLKRILRYDEEMTKFLKEKSESITDIAYHKVEESISERTTLWGYSSKIEVIALYMIASLYEVTNMSLQKLLYYYKALGYLFYKRALFEEECEAWVHGPVFVKIYEKYKGFGREIIRNEFREIDFTQLLTHEERELCDYVLENFAIYNGSVLREFTHRERPWLEARDGLGENVRCTNIIRDDSIQQYFNEKNEEFHLVSKNGLEKYIKSLKVV